MRILKKPIFESWAKNVVYKSETGRDRLGGSTCRISLGTLINMSVNTLDALKPLILIGLFVEIPTIWKIKSKQPSAQHQSDKAKTTMNKLKRVSSTVEKLSKDHALSKWRPRRVGIFFAQDENPSTSPSEGEVIAETNEPPWTCLVLVEPIKSFDSHIPLRYHDEDFAFCYRHIITKDSPKYDSLRTNARCQEGAARYTIEEKNLLETIKYVKGLLDRFIRRGESNSDLRGKYAKFFTALGNDIFWGWEEFAIQVAQFSAVYHFGILRL